MFYAGGYNNDPQHIGSKLAKMAPNGRALERPFHYEWSRRSMEPPNQDTLVFLDKDGQTWLFQGNANRKNWFLSRVKSIKQTLKR